MPARSHAERGHAVGHHAETRGTQEPPHQVDNGRMRMDAIGDEPDRGAGIRQQRTRQPRLAVRQRWHGIEQVCSVANPRIKPPDRLLVGCHAVTRTHQDAPASQAGDDFCCAWQLGGQGYHPNTGCQGPVCNRTERGQLQIARVVRALARGIEERSLDMQAQRLRAPEAWGPLANDCLCRRDIV